MKDAQRLVRKSLKNTDFHVFIDSFCFWRRKTDAAVEFGSASGVSVVRQVGSSGAVSERDEGVMLWAELLSLVEPHYPKGEKGRKPVGLELMLRVYFLQKWFALSDPRV